MLEDCADTKVKAQNRGNAVATALSGVNFMILLVLMVQVGDIMNNYYQWSIVEGWVSPNVQHMVMG